MAKLSALKKKFSGVPLPVRPSFRDPQIRAKVILGVLLLANAVAAALAFRPWAETPAQLEKQITDLKKQHIQRRIRIEQLKILAKKSEQARLEGDKFLSTYFLGRRTAASTLAKELTGMAKSAGIKPKEHSLAFEQVEGSDSLAMMTITANYDGTYADLVQYTNKLDRSPHFFIVESLSAAPQQGGNGVLNIAMKVNVFVRDDSGLPFVPGKPVDAAEADDKKEAEAPKPVAPAPKPATETTDQKAAPATAPGPVMPIPARQLPQRPTVKAVQKEGTPQ